MMQKISDLNLVDSSKCLVCAALAAAASLASKSKPERAPSVSPHLREQSRPRLRRRCGQWTCKGQCRRGRSPRRRRWLGRGPRGGRRCGPCEAARAEAVAYPSARASEPRARVAGAARGAQCAPMPRARAARGAHGRAVRRAEHRDRDRHQLRCGCYFVEWTRVQLNSIQIMCGVEYSVFSSSGLPMCTCPQRRRRRGCSRWRAVTSRSRSTRLSSERSASYVGRGSAADALVPNPLAHVRECVKMSPLLCTRSSGARRRCARSWARSPHCAQSKTSASYARCYTTTPNRYTHQCEASAGSCAASVHAARPQGGRRAPAASPARARREREHREVCRSLAALSVFTVHFNPLPHLQCIFAATSVDAVSCVRETWPPPTTWSSTARVSTELCEWTQCVNVLLLLMISWSSNGGCADPNGHDRDGEHGRHAQAGRDVRRTPCTWGLTREPCLQELLLCYNSDDQYHVREAQCV